MKISTIFQLWNTLEDDEYLELIILNIDRNSFLIRTEDGISGNGSDLLIRRKNENKISLAIDLNKIDMVRIEKEV